MISPDRIKELTEMGARAARALKPGDLFTGAWGAAKAEGITDRLEVSIYTNGYLDALGDRIIGPGLHTDARGYILDGALTEAAS